MMSYIFLFDTVRVPVFHLSKNRTGNRFLVPVCTVNRVPVHKTSNMMATSYKDKRQIKFLSTTSPPGVLENGKPHVNVDYNKHMGGVDRFDQLISYYPVGRSGIKWWRYIMWFIVNLSIVNSWIVYSNSERDPRPSKNYDIYSSELTNNWGQDIHPENTELDGSPKMLTETCASSPWGC